MKMAKASEADLAMAMKLANYLDAIERGQMPDELSEDSESIEWLDTRDQDQTEKLIDGLRRLLNQGSISRVIWGMAVICDPANKCIDPDADTIEHHPDLVKAAEQRDQLLAALECAESLFDRKWNSVVGSGCEFHWQPVGNWRHYTCKMTGETFLEAIAKVKP